MTYDVRLVIQCYVRLAIYDLRLQDGLENCAHCIDRESPIVDHTFLCFFFCSAGVPFRKSQTLRR